VFLWFVKTRENSRKNMRDIRTPKNTPPVRQTNTSTLEQRQASTLIEQQWVQLQRVIGNRATLQLIGDITHRRPSPIVQRAEGKLDPHTAVPTIESFVNARMAHVMSFPGAQVEDMKRRIKEQLTAAPADFKLAMLGLINDDTFWNTIVDEALLVARTTAADDQVRLGLLNTEAAGVRDQIRTGINGITAYDPDSLKHALRAGVNKTAVNGQMQMLVIKFITSAAEKVLTDKVTLRYGADPGGTRGELDYLESGKAANATNVAEGFTEFRKNFKINKVDITKKERTDLSAALLQMPTVQFFLTKNRSATATQTKDGVDLTVAAWKGGHNLMDDAYFADYDRATKKVVYTSEKIPTAHAQYAKVVEANNLLKRMIDSSILSTLLPPRVYVVRDKKFRAYASGNQVHISTDDGQEILVHEASHYIEDNAPSEMWHDIHTMMRARHKARVDERLAKKPRDAEADLLGHGDTGMKKEGRYRGTYAATGMYTSSAYDGAASTEVTSMTTQFLAKPDTAKTLIEKDPIQAALILRHLKPEEFRPIADQFKDVLPNMQGRRRR
jgi:hypothetical protein